MSRRTDARVQRGAPEGRGSRAEIAQDQRPENDGARGEEDYRRLIHNEFVQEALPNIPEIHGFHLCWLSTTSTHDPIHKRMRLGYTPVMVSDVKGGAELEGYKMKSGQFEGCVSCNEMVLFKIPLEKFQMIMAEFHHNMPLAEESAIYQKIEDLKNLSGSRSKGMVKELGNGFRSLKHEDEDDDEDAAPETPVSDRPIPQF